MPTKMNNKEVLLTKLINISIWTSQCSYSLMHKAEQCVCDLSFFSFYHFAELDLERVTSKKRCKRTSAVYTCTEIQTDQERK